MRALLIVILLSLSLSCTRDENAYDNSVIDLGLGFVAKEMCSCLFVVKQDEKFCRDYVKIKQVSPHITIEKSAVESRLFFFFKAHAVFKGEVNGCSLL